MGNVYAMTNQADGNAVQVFTRDPETGRLSDPKTFPTDGRGNGTVDSADANPLNSQGALALSPDGRLLFAANAGSDTITAFQVDAGHLVPARPTNARGVRPVSIAAAAGRVYVLNADDATIVGFTFDETGGLERIKGSTREAGDSPAQVLVSPDGAVLVVPDLAGKIRVFPLVDGVPGERVATYVGGAPFGSAFAGPDRIVVSNGATGGATAYGIGPDGELVPLGETQSSGAAACWTVVDNPADPQFAFVSNNGAGTISSFRFDPETGGLTAPNTDATAPNDSLAGTSPGEMAVSADHRFLYAMIGIGPGEEELRRYAIQPDGTLVRNPDAAHPLNPQPLPPGSEGIVAV